MLKISEVNLKMWEGIFHFSKFFRSTQGKTIENNACELTLKLFLFFLVLFP
jgi:hypothetical protein